jgi:hypothetical protein
VGTSIIDGTVEDAKLKRARAGIAIYDTIQFRLSDGSSRTVRKSVATQAVADQLAPGTSGRFYLFNSFDLKGVHGVRRSDGAAVYGFPGTSNRKLFLIIGAINLAWIALRVTTEGDVPLLGVGLLILAVVGFVLMGKGANEAKAQFDSDAGRLG